MDRTDKFLLPLFLLNCRTVTSTLRRWHLQSPGLGIFSLNTRFLPEFTPNPLRPSSAPPSTQLSSGDSNPLPLGPGSALSAQTPAPGPAAAQVSPLPRPHGLYSPQAQRLELAQPCPSTRPLRKTGSFPCCLRQHPSSLSSSAPRRDAHGSLPLPSQ